MEAKAASPKTAVIITAAGSGTRLGSQRPKALVELGEVPLVITAARNALSCRLVDQLIISAPEQHVQEITELCARDLPAVSRGALNIKLPVRVVPGGPSRQASVANALAVLEPAVDVVLVHDAARPLTPASVFERVINAVRSGASAVIPVLAVTDTIKQVAGDPEQVTGTLARDQLRRVQTPQGFTRDGLVSAHHAYAARATDEATSATDDASLLEAMGVDVTCVQGDELAIKITTRHDLRLAEYLSDFGGMH